jgi:hypothetical protein
MITGMIELACDSKACAPPPVGTGGSRSSGSSKSGPSTHLIRSIRKDIDDLRKSIKDQPYSGETLRSVNEQVVRVGRRVDRVLRSAFDSDPVCKRLQSDVEAAATERKRLEIDRLRGRRQLEELHGRGTPEYDAAEAKYWEETRIPVMDAMRRERVARDALTDRRAAIFKNVMSQFVEMGGSVRVIGVPDSDGDLRRFGSVVESVYPRSWIDQSNGRTPPLEVNIVDDIGRAVHLSSPVWSVIKLWSRTPTFATDAAHEMWHRMEGTNPVIGRLERAYREQRTTSTTLTKVGLNKEDGYATDFFMDYAGRDYGVKAQQFTEVGSTGIEHILRTDSLEGRLPDLDHRGFVLGLMVGVQ